MSALVNIKYSRIFNGIFEMQKSTQIEKRFAEMCAKNASAPHVYHVRFKHDRRLPENNYPLKDDSAPVVSEGGRTPCPECRRRVVSQFESLWG